MYFTPDEKELLISFHYSIKNRKKAKGREGDERGKEKCKSKAGGQTIRDKIKRSDWQLSDRGRIERQTVYCDQPPV